MHKPGRVAIIGAGPTGLGAAWRLKELGHEDVAVYEASAFVGGLSASHVDEKGFTWDVGGHVQFSHYKYFDRLMDALLGVEGWLHHERESWVWIRDRFVPYPFQYNIRRLPPKDLQSCLDGLVQVNEHPFPRRPEHFREWIHATFGEGIAKVFMVPYNFKVWAYPPEDMSYSWIGERVAVTDLSRVLENIRLGKDDVSWGPNNTFRFPKQGGTGAIWRRLAEEIGGEKIRLKTLVRSVCAREKKLVLDGGEKEGYDVLLNTAPLDIFAQMMEDFPDKLKRKARGLVHSSTNIVGVGLRGRPAGELAKKCWMYFPEDNCPFYRVTVFSNYSPHNVPDIRHYWSLMAEISESPKKPVDGESVVRETILGMVRTRLIESPDQVVSTWSYRVEHGYPTPSLGRNDILNAVLPALEAEGVYSRGRFGVWKYEVGNQDHSLMQGVEWVNSLLLGETEVTWTDPAAANAGGSK